MYDGVVKILHLLRCCEFDNHYDVLLYAKMIIKFTRLEHAVFYLSISNLRFLRVCHV
jgi:hypothetical protein